MKTLQMNIAKKRNKQQPIVQTKIHWLWFKYTHDTTTYCNSNDKGVIKYKIEHEIAVTKPEIMT